MDTQVLWVLISGCVFVRSQQQVLSESPVTPGTHTSSDTGSASSLGPQFQSSCLLAGPWVEEGHLSPEYLVLVVRDYFQPGADLFVALRSACSLFSPGASDPWGHSGHLKLLMLEVHSGGKLGLPCPQVQTLGK